MSLRDLWEQTVGFFSGIIPAWLAYIQHPLEMSRNALSELATEQDKFKRSVEVFGLSFTLSVVLLAPLHSLVGIGFPNLGFSATAFVVQFGIFVWASAGMHFGFRMSKIQSCFADTLLLYVICIVPYTPIITLFQYPELVTLFSGVHDAKQQHMGFLPTLKYISAALTAASSSLPIVQALKEVFFFAEMVPLVIFAEGVARRYGVSRQATLTSMSFSVTYFVLGPVIAIALLYIFNIYGFVSPHK